MVGQTLLRQEADVACNVEGDGGSAGRGEGPAAGDLGEDRLDHGCGHGGRVVAHEPQQHRPVGVVPASGGAHGTQQVHGQPVDVGRTQVGEFGCEGQTRPGWGPPCGRRRDRCRCGRGRRPTGGAARPRLRPDPRRGRPGWVGRHRGAQGSAGGGARDADPWPPLCPSPGLSDGGGGGGAAVQSGSGRTGPGSLTRP